MIIQTLLGERTQSMAHALNMAGLGFVVTALGIGALHLVGAVPW